MAGHGALTLALREPQLYRSVSAFSPIVNPTQVPWGRKAFEGYLGKDEQRWTEHDAGAPGCRLQEGRHRPDPAPAGGLRPLLLLHLHLHGEPPALARGAAVVHPL